MTDIQTLTYPTVLDREALHEFSDALTDRAHDIERDMARLSTDPGNRVLIADIFRALHNIKGDAALCSVPMAGLVAHPLESILTRLRSGDVHYTQMLGEVILLALDRLELAVDALVANRPVVQLKLAVLVEGLEKMGRAPQSDIDLGAAQLINTITGFRPQTFPLAVVGKPSSQVSSKGGVAKDLRFFRSLALQFETRSALFAGRTDRLHQLALDTNRIAGSPVDEVQLEAALYLHDLGMMFLPESVWIKLEKMSKVERAILHAHPGFAAGLLERMEGWKGAAEMVQQHHETWDGKGYPAKLDGTEICSGAKIIAIVDAFEAVMLKHGARSHGSSVLRAIAEINACDKQFAPEWIEPFNAVIRTMLEH
ncbi:MAG: metal-dependent [Gallionellaceae bacterium]|nr:MAG: metal-dependent [Gallionellaceae bacterium]